MVQRWPATATYTVPLSSRQALLSTRTCALEVRQWLLVVCASLAMCLRLSWLPTTPCVHGGVNETLLKSSGTTDKVIGHIANAYRLVFHGQTSVFDAVIQIKEQVPEGKEVNAIIKFIKGTQLGIIGKI